MEHIRQLAACAAKRGGRGAGICPSYARSFMAALEAGCQSLAKRVWKSINVLVKQTNSLHHGAGRGAWTSHTLSIIS